MSPPLVRVKLNRVPVALKPTNKEDSHADYCPRQLLPTESTDQGAIQPHPPQCDSSHPLVAGRSSAHLSKQTPAPIFPVLPLVNETQAFPAAEWTQRRQVEASDAIFAFRTDEPVAQSSKMRAGRDQADSSWPATQGSDFRVGASDRLPTQACPRHSGAEFSHAKGLALLNPRPSGRLGTAPHPTTVARGIF